MTSFESYTGRVFGLESRGGGGGGEGGGSKGGGGVLVMGVDVKKRVVESLRSVFVLPVVVKGENPVSRRSSSRSNSRMSSVPAGVMLINIELRSRRK